MWPKTRGHHSCRRIEEIPGRPFSDRVSSRPARIWRKLCAGVCRQEPGVGGLAGVRYHLIGHLQSNKARLACELFQVIQTVDSPKLLNRINQAAGEIGATIEAMIEVKLSTEESKSGADPALIPALLDAAAACSHISLTGLMTMPPWSEDPEHSRPYFRQLADLARQYNLPKLSMGMSGDLETAIEEGATIVRVGTALFGKRPKPPSA